MENSLSLFLSLLWIFRIGFCVRRKAVALTSSGSRRIIGLSAKLLRSRKNTDDILEFRENHARDKGRGDGPLDGITDG